MYPLIAAIMRSPTAPFPGKPLQNQNALLARYPGDLAGKTGSDAETIKARYQAGIPLGRFARPEEVAGVIVGLCWGLFTYVNGANIIIDGGELSR